MNFSTLRMDFSELCMNFSTVAAAPHPTRY